MAGLPIRILVLNLGDSIADASRRCRGHSWVGGRFGYAWFREHYDAWKKRLSPTMRQSHAAGEKVFVDFAGDTIDVIDPLTGAAQAMKLFVARPERTTYDPFRCGTPPPP